MHEHMICQQLWGLYPDYGGMAVLMVSPVGWLEGGHAWGWGLCRRGGLGAGGVCPFSCLLNLTCCLQVPVNFWFKSAPMYLSGKVVTGFGRGSRLLGTPTANIDPTDLKKKLHILPKGVYFG